MLLLGLEDLSMAVGNEQAANAFDDVRQPQVVESLDFAQHTLHFAMRFSKLRVGPEHMIGAPVELQVQRASIQIAIELFVFPFPLLPAGSHHRDGSIGKIELLESLSETRSMVLRAEEPDGSVFLCHSALTFTVSPVRSNIRRS